MRLLRVVRGSVVLVGLLLNEAAWADAFVNFFYRQKVGQEITATGRFRRFSYQKQFFRRDDKTGEVEYFYYFGMSMMPTKLIGDGALSLPASRLDAVLFLYADEALVKDLPEQGEDLWFTGTLIGFQYGISGIISSAGSGGDPYILLKRVSTQPPQETTSPQTQTPSP